MLSSNSFPGIDEELRSHILSTYESLKRQNWLNNTSNTTKSQEQSIHWRQMGNESYRQNRHEEALLNYNKSLCYAYENSQELPLAFANRSAVNLKLKNYFACLQDINRALKLDYPESLKPKILKRRILCMKKIQEDNETKTKVLSLYPQFKELNQWENYISLKFHPFDISEDITEPVEETFCELPKFNRPNEYLSNVGHKVRLNFNEYYGRHFVATDNIKPGEAIGSDRPFVTILLKEQIHKVCSFCYTASNALIPCQGCSLFMFCSKKCRENALELYHRVECEAAPYLLKGPDFLHILNYLPLKLLLIGTKQGTELENLLHDANFRDAFATKQTFVDRNFQNDYATVCNLEIRPECATFRNRNLIASKSAAYLHVLQRTSFFQPRNNQNPKELTEVDIVAAMLIVHNYYVIVCNSIGISKITLTNECKTEASPIGVGLYPLFSLLNHSCNPNVCCTFSKDTLVIRAQRPIAAGEQIFISYQLLYLDVPSKERQRKILNHRGFKCECEACINDWPPLRKKYLAAKVNTSESIVRTLKKYLYNKLMKLSKNKNFIVPDDMIEFYSELITMMHENYTKPSSELISAEYALEQLMLIATGVYLETNDFENIIRYILQYVQKHILVFENFLSK